MTYVYVAQALSGPIKIGRSGDPDKRLANLSTSSSEPICLAAVHRCQNAPLVEKTVKNALADKRIKGEWFSATVDEADVAIQAALRMDAEQVYEIKGVRMFVMPVDKEFLEIVDRFRHKWAGYHDRAWTIKQIVFDAARKEAKRK